MPICHVCQTFFVRNQTFNSLLTFTNLCVLCETYKQYALKHEVIPISYNTLEVYTFDTTEHPALTKRFFEWLMKRPNSPVLFYDQGFNKHLEALSLCNGLLKPFRLFHYQKVPDNFLMALEDKVNFMTEK